MEGVVPAERFCHFVARRLLLSPIAHVTGWRSPGVHELKLTDEMASSIYSNNACSSTCQRDCREIVCLHHAIPRQPRWRIFSRDPREVPQGGTFSAKSPPREAHLGWKACVA